MSGQDESAFRDGGVVPADGNDRAVFVDGDFGPPFVRVGRRGRVVNDDRVRFAGGVSGVVPDGRFGERVVGGRDQSDGAAVVGVFSA